MGFDSVRFLPAVEARTKKQLRALGKLAGETWRKKATAEEIARFDAAASGTSCYATLAAGAAGFDAEKVWGEMIGEMELTSDTISHAFYEAFQCAAMTPERELAVA